MNPGQRRPHSARSSLRVVAIALASVSCWIATLACGWQHDLPTTSRAGSLSGVIRYDGTMGGAGRPLAIAVYRSFPPSGPPVATRLVERYELPYRYEFSGLAPGTYYVGALIDVDRMDTRYAGMLVPRRDPHGYASGGEPISLTADRGAASADIELRDPRE